MRNIDLGKIVTGLFFIIIITPMMLKIGDLLYRNHYKETGCRESVFIVGGIAAATFSFLVGIFIVLNAS